MKYYFKEPRKPKKIILFLVCILVPLFQTEGKSSSNPFVPLEGMYKILAPATCIQSDSPVYCPWFEVEVRTNRQVTCFKFKVETSVQHYCFETIDSYFEKAHFSSTEGAKWDYQNLLSKENRTMKQVSLLCKDSNDCILKIEEYSWHEAVKQPPSEEPLKVQIDLKIQLSLRKIQN